MQRIASRRTQPDRSGSVAPQTHHSIARMNVNPNTRRHHRIFAMTSDHLNPFIPEDGKTHLFEFVLLDLPARRHREFGNKEYIFRNLVS